MRGRKGRPLALGLGLPVARAFPLWRGPLGPRFSRRCSWPRPPARTATPRPAPHGPSAAGRAGFDPTRISVVPRLSPSVEIPHNSRSSVGVVPSSSRASLLGAPDVGLLTMTEMADYVRRVVSTGTLHFPPARDCLEPDTLRGYTRGMKTAVSIPDEVFEQAERLARRTRKSRSHVFSSALREYVARHSPDEVTDAMDRVCEQVGSHADPFVGRAARRSLEHGEW